MDRVGTAAFCLVLILTAQGAFTQPTDAKLRIEPQKILIDLFYSGAQIQISGESRAGEDLAVVCTGEESTVELKQKGKIWGLLWVNTGDIAFKHVPRLYQVASSKKFSDLAPKADLSRAGVGFPGMESRIVPEMNEERHRFFSELMKLKKHEGLYSIQEGGLEIHTAEGARQTFSAIFHFPPSAGPGAYRFRLMSFANGRAATLADGVISVRLAGAAAFIHSLSLKHGLIYGILSVVIALAAGLLTGFVFGRRPGKGGH